MPPTPVAVSLLLAGASSAHDSPSKAEGEQGREGRVGGAVDERMGGSRGLDERRGVEAGADGAINARSQGSERGSLR
jgi:hypothetical protein